MESVSGCLFIVMVYNPRSLECIGSSEPLANPCKVIDKPEVRL